MLKNVNQFIIEHGIKNHLYLLSPPLTLAKDVIPPRFSIYHYLDYDSDVEFPGKNLPILTNIPKNKRIPVTSIDDLFYKDGIVSLHDKKIYFKIKKWLLENRKWVKRYDLTSTEIKETNVIGIVNYNLLKHLYNYKENLLTRGYRFNNLYRTLFKTVNDIVTKFTDEINIVRINVPFMIPSINVIKRLIGYSEIKFNRIATDNDFRLVIELIKLLDKETQSSSIFSMIPEKSLNNVVIEFAYKDYATYLRLNTLVALSQDSSLESRTKLTPIKVQKLFLLFLYKIQQNVEAELKAEEEKKDRTVEKKEDNEVPVINVNKVEDEEGQDNTTQDEEPEQTSDQGRPSDSFSSQLKQSEQLKQVNDEDILTERMISDFTSSLDEEFERFDKDTDYMDKYFLDSSESTDQTEEAEQEDLFKPEKYKESVYTYVKTPQLEDQVQVFLKESETFKTLSTTELKQLKESIEQRKRLVSPYNRKEKLDDFTVIPNEVKELKPTDKNLPVKSPIVEESLKEDTIKAFDRKYIKDVLKKDIVASVKDIERAGILLKNYEVEEISDAMGRYEIHRITVRPLKGKDNTLLFKLPVIDDEGEFYATGIKERLRKQRSDLPIRKIDPYRVGLTSAYGKLFVSRIARKAYDQYGYINSYIKKDYIGDKTVVTDITPGKVFNNYAKLPNILSSLSMEFKEVVLKDYTIILDNEKLKTQFKEDVLDEFKSNQLFICGYRNSDNHAIYVDMKNVFYVDNERIGDISALLDIEHSKLPKPFTQVKILGDDLPLGVVLGYYIGLDKLVALRNIPYKVIGANERYHANENDIVLRFEDKKLILTSDREEDHLLFNGFNYFKDFLKTTLISEYNQKFIYLNLIQDKGFTIRHLKELDLLNSLFLDSVTIDVLRDLKEPVEFIPLLLRANELLSTFDHPDINDPSYSRIRGYDRIPSMIYKTLCESIRSHNLGFNKSNKIELDPYKVWNTITMDNTKKLSEDINPILELKESEIVTLTGGDGLSKGAIPKLLRRYHKNDMGLISEGTVDSSDVAVNSYMTPSAKIKNIRGVVSTSEESLLTNPEKIFSTSVLLAPMAEYDDPKRINFINIQNGHMIFAEGYKQPALRTGYESVIPYRVGKLYTIIAEDDGVVKEITKSRLTVSYSTLGVVSYPIGTQYGQMEGTLYPHELITPLKVGSTFKANDFLAYNKNFFEPDWLDKKSLILKTSRIVTTALSLTNEVFEDSSSISSKVSNSMSTEIIKDNKDNPFIIDFKTNILNLVPVGTHVKPDTVLFTLVEETTDYTNLPESTLQLLQSMVNFSPRAKVEGIIDRYEIKYNGDVSDMSPTLQKLAKQLDKQIEDDTKHTFYETKTNRVTSEYRIGRKNLNIDQLVLFVYIRVKVTQAVGDKGTFANQMKSVVCDVFKEDSVITESGDSIDAFFGYKGILNRIVLSPILIGTTNRLIRYASKELANIYFRSAENPGL